MVGGLSFLVNGNMCCGITGTALMVRVGADGRELALREPHVRPMRFAGRALSGFICVEPEGFAADDAPARADDPLGHAGPGTPDPADGPAQGPPGKLAPRAAPSGHPRCQRPARIATAAEAQPGGTSSSSASARPARSGSSRVGAGSARSPRRLIQIERMPRSWAGTMSWKWLWATWTWRVLSAPVTA